ncbi:MAG: hypothetical protein ACOX4D_05245 [Bacteroidales bacterium]|jgi:hypothetical protein
MCKKSKIFILTSLLLLLLSCNNNKASSSFVNWDEPDMVAIAFLGYHQDTSNERFVQTYKYYQDTYKLPKDIDFVELEGDEYYLVIPRDRNTKIEVREYSFDIFCEGLDEDSGDLLKEFDDGEPFIIKCNVSDAISNVIFIIENNEGEKVTYSPTISLRDGSLVVLGTGEVKDITRYHQSGEDYQSYKLFDYSDLGFKVEFDKGLVQIYLNENIKEAFTTFGGQGEVKALEQSPYILKEMYSDCVDIFVGEIGQEVYPILCLLSDKGEVEILDIYDATIHNNFKNTKKIKGLQNIVSFKNTVMHYGFTSYNEIFLIDANGNEYPISEYY